MRIFTVFTIALTLVVGVFFPREANAERATPQEMELVCQNWLAYMVYQQGEWAGNAHPAIVGVSELVQDDTVLARCFTIAPRGYVAVPTLKELPPIQAYSEEYGLDVTATVGFPQLLREVLLDRVRRFVRTYGSLDASQPPIGPVLLGRVHRQEWDRFLASREQFDDGLRRGVFGPLRDAGPLLTTSWHQGEPYNNLCPMGDGGRCVVGCVATAVAQIMKYHNWPPDGKGWLYYDWDGDQSCGGNAHGEELGEDFRDCYDWGNMANSCTLGYSSTEDSALAELCYEIGVAFHMDFGKCASYASTSDALTVFPTYFRYDNSIDLEDRNAHTAQTWFDLIKAEIDSARPILYDIRTSGGGHAMVCDGWRIADSQNQYHMNYGDGAQPYTGWYTIDSCSLSVDYMQEFLIRNINPCGCLSGTLGPGLHHVENDILVKLNDTLTILPGTTLLFDSPYSFRIYGTLLAEGTASDSIVFTTNQSGEDRWQGLHFLSCSSNSSSRLAYCVIEKGYKYGGVFCSDSSPTFANCAIRANSANHGFGGGGVFCLRSSPNFAYCTISNNSEAGGGHGGGVSCDISSSPAFTNCSIIGNSAPAGGGVSGGGIFTNCTITGNSASGSSLGYGGGVYCMWPSVYRNCIVSDNSATHDGGGVACGASSTFINCTINNNSGRCGGGIVCWESSVFANCRVSFNSAAYGGGAHCYYSSATFTNCTVSYNSALDGGGVCFEGSSAPALRNCVLWGNVPNQICHDDSNRNTYVTYTDIQDGWPGEGNIDIDPMFANTVEGDSHLRDSSPCIGAADPDTPPSTDPDGNPRPNPPGSIPDMGTYENWLAGPVGHVVISIDGSNAVLNWPPFGFTYRYKIYGSAAPFALGDLLDTVTDTTWTDVATSGKPSPYFYYVRAWQEEP